MAEDTNGPYHRLGGPGGPGAEILALEVQSRGASGQPIAADLLDAQGDVTEVELLRTLCHTLGIQWGRDDLGWWAAPRHLTEAARQSK